MSRVTSVIDAYEIGAHDWRFRCRFRNHLGLEQYRLKVIVTIGTRTTPRTSLQLRNWMEQTYPISHW